MLPKGNPLSYLVPFIGNKDPDSGGAGDEPPDGGDGVNPGPDEGFSLFGFPKRAGETRVAGGYWYRAEARHRKVKVPAHEDANGKFVAAAEVDRPYLDWVKIRPAFTDYTDRKTGRVERSYVDVNGTPTGAPDVIRQGLPPHELQAPGGVITNPNDPRLNLNLRPPAEASPTGVWKIGTLRSAVFDSQGNYKNMESVPGWVPGEQPKPFTPQEINPGNTLVNPLTGQVIYHSPPRGETPAELLQRQRYQDARARQSSIDSANFAAMQTGIGKAQTDFQKQLQEHASALRQEAIMKDVFGENYTPGQTAKPWWYYLPGGPELAKRMVEQRSDLVVPAGISNARWDANLNKYVTTYGQEIPRGPVEPAPEYTPPFAGPPGQLGRYADGRPAFEGVLNPFQAASYRENMKTYNAAMSGPGSQAAETARRIQQQAEEEDLLRRRALATQLTRPRTFFQR